MKFGVVFASTGGQKMVRALRSFRRTEPDLRVHIVIDVSSATWKANNESPSASWLESHANVEVRFVQNTAYINGILNAGMRWVAELGYDYGCLFHDDVVFSPLHQNHGNLSEWFSRVESDTELRQASGISLSLIQAFVRDTWRRAPAEWDAMDLESEPLWQTLCPGGVPAGLYAESGHADEIVLPNFFVQYHIVREQTRSCRLGPSGQIVPVATWEAVGGFDEKDGIFYDIQYPAECAMRKLPPVLNVRSVPHLHLHNQSIGFGDLATGIWNDTMGAFTKRYGDYGKFWARELTT